MTHSIETFFAAWADADNAAVKAAVTDAVYYADPNTPEPVTGADDLAQYVAQFSQHMPGGGAQVVEISEHHGHARATVDFLKDGNPMMRGQYFADLDADGRITRLVGFTGMGEG